MKKRIVGCVAVLMVVLLELISCQLGKGRSPTATPDTTQLTTPGKSHFYVARERYNHSVVLKAGETKSLDVTLETLKDGPGWVIYTISRVTAEYSEERLPLPEELEINISPISFVAEPSKIYSAQLVLKTSPGLASGTYFLLLECDFEKVFWSKGWIEVNISDK